MAPPSYLSELKGIIAWRGCAAAGALMISDTPGARTPITKGLERDIHKAHNIVNVIARPRR